MSLHEKAWNLQGEHAACRERIAELKDRQVGRPDNRREIEKRRLRMMQLERKSKELGMALQ
jgi:hypothetical protein